MALLKIHVVWDSTKSQWVVKWAGGKEIARYSTKFEAESRAAVSAASWQLTHQTDTVEVIVHNQDGKISNPNTHGNDPNPPKDTKP